MFSGRPLSRYARAALGMGLAVAAASSPARAQPPPQREHSVPPGIVARERAPDEGKSRAPDARRRPRGKALPARKPPPASARGGDAKERNIRIALTSGYGIDLNPDVTDVNPFAVSFGVRGGYTLGAVYLGTRFLFCLGEARTLEDGSEQSADEWLLGFEGGYGARFGPLSLRPELGLGLAISSSEGARAAMDAPMAMAVPVDTSSEDPYLELGLVVELDLTRRLFVGADTRAALILGKRTVTSDGEVIGLLLLGTLGYRF